MLKNFRTLAQAKKDRDILQEYINLIEHYRPSTFEQYVVIEYALQGSIKKTTLNLNQRGYSFESRPITTDVVKQALTSKPQKGDQLHRWIRPLYLKEHVPAAENSLSLGFSWKHLHPFITKNLKSVYIK